MKIQRLILSVVFLAFVSADLAAGQSLSRMQGPGGRQTSGELAVIGFSPDDRYVYMLANDEVAGDSNGFIDVVRQDRWTGSNIVVTHTSGGGATNGDVSYASLSANGRHLFTSTSANNILPGDANFSNDVYVYDLGTAGVQRVSVAPGGADSNSDSTTGGVSNNGRYVAFESEASNLVAGDGNTNGDVFLRDTALGTTVRINLQPGGAESPIGAGVPQISADGRFVIYVTYADDLVAGDTNLFRDVFCFDRTTSTTSRINLSPQGIQSDGDMEPWVRISADARWVVFSSFATNLVPGQAGNLEVFLLDRQGSSMSVQSVGSGGVPSDNGSYTPWISNDGRYVAFFSNADSLDPNDSDGDLDMYWRDKLLDVTQYVSHSTGGLAGQPPPFLGGFWGWPAMSGSGRFVSFVTNYEDLVAGDNNNGDTFLWDSQSPVQPIESHCLAKVNSAGCTPQITSGGEPHAAGTVDAFFVSAHGVLNNKPGLFLWSLTQASTPFGGGTLCVGAPLVRSTASVSGGTPAGINCSGSYSFAFTQAYMASKGLTSGTKVYTQAWSRDPGFAAPNNIGLTDSLSFTVAP